MVLQRELEVTDTQVFLGDAKPPALAKIQDTLMKAQAAHQQAQTDLEAHHAHLACLRDVMKTIEAEAQRVVVAQLAPRQVQTVKRLYAALQKAVEANAELWAIQEAARVKRPWGHFSPFPFCEVTAHDEIGRPVSALEALVESWCGSREVKRLLAD